MITTPVVVICFVLGFLFVIIEMFHPGFGAPGIIGGILLVLGVIFVGILTSSLFIVLIFIVAIIAVLGIMLTIVLQSAAKGRLSKILILKDTQKKEAGYIGTDDLKYFMDKEGVSLTILRPTGIADFNGIKLDVITEGEFIQKDKKVKIIQVQGNRIVVKEII
ncbi:MAG: NfeD family protein [Bacillota bacterium]|nr:NfeD family protein [Bacillota bacterium]